MQSIKHAIETIANGGMIIVVDDADRENEGDLIIAAEHASPEAIRFMARHGCGLVCMPMLGADLDRLQIPMQYSNRKDPLATAFTVSIDAAEHITTGISAADRAYTMQLVANDTTTADDISMPGHVFPLRARDGGVLERPGHTEAAIDFARLAGLKPMAAICEIMAEDGSMMRYDELCQFAKQYDLPLVTIKDLIAYREQHDLILFPKPNLQQKHLHLQSQASLPTAYGEFMCYVFNDLLTGDEHVALCFGELNQATSPLVRIHSECLTGDVFASKRCDCGSQLSLAMKRIAYEGSGCILYLRQEGRGIGLSNKIAAYALQEQGLDTVDANLALGFAADLRDYRSAVDMLEYFHVKQFRLLTNNPQKLAAMQQIWSDDVRREALHAGHCPENQVYLQTKTDKLGHLQ